MDLEFYRLLHFSFTKLLASIDHRVQISSHSFIVRFLEPSRIILYIDQSPLISLILLTSPPYRMFSSDRFSFLHSQQVFVPSEHRPPCKNGLRRVVTQRQLLPLRTTAHHFHKNIFIFSPQCPSTRGPCNP